MKNTKRSAFTIVELVIVIAVIAILSAVLIPTFGAIIKDANIAADQTAAATLTTELHVDLMGETIDSESELMERIAKIDEKKLTPKAAAYGVHFWFDMDNQMILAKTAKEIEDLVAEKNAESAYVEHTGVQLINDAQTAAAPASLNINFRSLLGGNFFLIDKGGSAFVNALNKIAEFSGTSHADLVADVNGVFVDVVVDDQNFVDKFKAALASTVIITENVVLQPATATNVYFDPGIRFINDHDVTINISSGVVDLPSTVIGVAPGALVFGGADVVLNTACKDASDVEFVFANASTNATIKTAADSYKIAQADGTVTIEESEGNLANKLVLVSDIVDGKAANTVPNITLSNKLKFEDFSVYAAAGNPGDDNIIYNNANGISTLYVSYNEYAKGEKEIVLSLLANDGKTNIDGADSAIEWNFNETNTYKIKLNSTTNTATVTAKAKNINGELLERKLNIVVVKASKATVTIDGAGTYSVPYTGLGQNFEWGYNGTNGSKEITFEVIDHNSYSHAHGTSNLTLTYDEDMFSEYNEDGKRYLKLNTVGGDGEDKLNLVKSGATTITLDVDGIITSTVNVTVHDYTKSKLVSNYNHAESDVRPYYIGNGAVTLGHILKLRTDGDLPYDSKVVILAKSGDKYLPVGGFDNFDVTYGAEFNNDSTDTIPSWENVGINFTATTTNAFDIPIQIKITPTAANNDQSTAIINLTYVNGTNVTTATDLKDAADANGNVVMMDDISIVGENDGLVYSDDYSLAFGTGETLYGNGFVLYAPKFVASTDKDGSATEQKGSKIVTNREAVYGKCTKCGDAGGLAALGCILGHDRPLLSVTFTTSTVACDYYITDAYLINLAGGTVDNIYIDGPVYADLQYKEIANTVTNADGTTTDYADSPYYVSGIKTSGSVKSTIKNSYVSGFRTPVNADGSDLEINNTTLRGGNYANLELASGNLTLDNVTTVQDQNGIQATVGSDLNRKIAGLGIALGEGAANSTITIQNRLDQYNWIEQNTTAYLPEIEGLDLKSVLNMLMNGVSGTGALKLHRYTYYIHEHATETNNQYINTGIVFAKLDFNENINSFVANSPINLTLVQGDRTYSSALNGTEYEQLNAINVLQLRKSVPSGFESMITGTIDNLVGANKDAILYMWSYKDGQNWIYSTEGAISGEYDDGTAENIIVKKISNATQADATNKINNTALEYSGYYDNSNTGAYEYWFESTNTKNQ